MSDLLSILQTDNRIYNDINNMIMKYNCENSLYEIYLKYYGRDSLEEYFQMIHCIQNCLISYSIIPGDSDKEIKIHIKKFIKEVCEQLNSFDYDEKKDYEIYNDPDYDIDYSKYNDINDEYYDDEYTADILKITPRQLLFLKYHMIPFLLNQKNVFETCIYTHPKIVISYSNFKIKISDKLSLGKMNSIYIKLWLSSREDRWYGITSSLGSYLHDTLYIMLDGCTWT